VIFESALSLRMMIETDKVDLGGNFCIRFAKRDCALDFPGYSLQTVEGLDNLFHLVKMPAHP
jgi:hypothetical protein